ncbi:unnamed protein product [Angiostrongylus costaricensis]|uniref:Uncharacterized protein n=1 Tax=Angiostrongylus costaricensis TaxID=334426 RepID=A0A0R3PPP6_ANGCS|nr:unnamed protein product [Angiostrongylus costaricensis]
MRNALAAISKEARIDFSKPLDWAGITAKRKENEKKMEDSKDLSSDNKQEETGSGEKEETSKSKRSPAAVVYSFDAIIRLVKLKDR